MPSLHWLPVALRRLLARRPWIYWLVVTVTALASGFTVRQRMGDIDDARDAWGEARQVLVARSDTRPGELLAVDVRRVPAALVPIAALEDDAGDGPLIARQDVPAGAIVTDV